MTRVLELRGLCAGYDGVPAVRDLDLHVDAGEVVALLGPNGAGKTTTLLTISGLLAPLAGSIDVLGAGPPSTRRPQEVARRGLAHVPEHRALFAELTVRENLTLAQRPGAWSLERVLELFPPLGQRLRSYGNQLSGGEQQMLAIGRALMLSPRLLLMDEPSEGLAPLIVEQVGATVARLKADGLPILLVEQNLSLALEHADRVYVLSKGQVVFQGTPAQLWADAELHHRYLGV